jgi:hypothetical protein
MKKTLSDRAISPRKPARLPKEGSGYAVLRFIGGFFQASAVLLLAAAVLGSCYGSIRAVQSFLPYQDQKMAGFITVIYLTDILAFLACGLLLGGLMAAAGTLLRLAGTRRAPEVPDAPDASMAERSI